MLRILTESLFPLALNIAKTAPEGAERILKPQKIEMKVVSCDQMEKVCKEEQGRTMSFSVRRQASGTCSCPTDSNTLWISLKVINDDRTFKPLYTHTQAHTLHTHTHTHLPPLDAVLQHKTKAKKRWGKIYSAISSTEGQQYSCPLLPVCNVSERKYKSHVASVRMCHITPMTLHSHSTMYQRRLFLQ
jgi:hypothetical protein